LLTLGIRDSAALIALRFTRMIKTLKTNLSSV